MAAKRNMKTPAAWVGKRVNPAKWNIPAGYAVSRSTGRLQAVKPAAAPLAASRQIDGNMRRSGCIETYSSAQPVNLFAGYRPDKTPTLANRQAYGFDAGIVLFHIEQATTLKATFTRHGNAVVFTLGMMAADTPACWYATSPALSCWLDRDGLAAVKNMPFAAAVPVEPVRYRVPVGSIRARVPLTPEYCIARCLLAAFYAVNPDYRALLDTQAVCALPVVRSLVTALPTFARQRAPSARRASFNTRFYARRGQAAVSC